MIGERRALLAVLTQGGVAYFTFFAPVFNHIVVLLPQWRPEIACDIGWRPITITH
jgi:hypothetical protein